jgi:hypothetical protein
MLPERTAPSEIVKLAFRATLVGILLATILYKVFNVPWLVGLTILITLVFLDGFVESSKWKERLIRGGIVVCLMVVMNMTIWPIGKSLFASYFPTLSRAMVRAKMGTEMWVAKKIDSPAVEAKNVLFEANEEYEKKDLSREVTKLIAAGDTEGAAELIRTHQEKRAKIEAAINPKPATNSSGPGVLDKAKGWFSSKDKSTKTIPPLRGQDVHLSLKAGEETNMVSIPMNMFYDFCSCPGSKYMVVLPNGQELPKGTSWPEFRTFKIVALSDAEIDLKYKVS